MENKIEILKELKGKLVNQLGDNIVKIILFGSQANGMAKDDSDYDVLIVLKNDYDYNYKKKIIEICYELELEYEIFIDVLLVSLHELKHTIKGKEPLIIEALDEGILI